MPIVKLSPDAIAASTNLTGAVTAIDEDPASPDANWLTATSATLNTDARVTFPTPTRVPAGSQDFKLWLRKTTGTPDPTVNVSLYQGGTLRTTILTGTSITSTTGQLVTATWNSSNLVTVLDGSDVECRVEGVRGTSSGGAGALPAYSAAGTVFASNTMPQTNLALDSPTHVAGDLLIALVCCRNTNNDGLLTTVNGTGGTTGWTLENNGGSMYGGAQNARIAFGWKVAASASEVCSITTTGGTTTDRISARVYKFTAADGFATPAVANIAAGTTGTLSASQDMTMPTVAAGGAANGLAVCLYGISISSTQAAPTGATGGTWTEPVAEDAGTNATTGIFIADDSDAGGLTGGTSASGATSGVWVNVSLRLNPGTAVTPVNTVEVGAIGWDELYAEPAPVAWWPCDEGTGTNVNDSAGTADLTLTSAVWGTGKVGPYALSLNGTTDYGSVAAPASVAFGTGPMSVSVWVKTPNNATYRTIIDNKNAGSNNAGFNLQVIESGVAAWRTANGTAQLQLDSDISCADDQWHHIVGTHRWNGTDVILNVYIDGRLRSNISWPLAAWNITSATTLYVGTYTGGLGNFSGLIDDIRLFNLELTGAEIAAIYAAGNPPQSGTVAAVGNSPTINVPTGLTLNPPQGTIAASGGTPTQSKVLAAQAGLASATGQSPGVGQLFLPAPAEVLATGDTPALTSTTVLTPTAGTAAASGNAPTLTLDQNSTAWLFPVTTNSHSGSGSGTTPIGDGTAAWFANSRVQVADGVSSYIGPTNMPSGMWTDWLRCLNYPNNIPSGATIRGIEVRLYIAQTSGAVTLEKISLLNAGGWLIASLKTPATPLTGSYQLLTFGGAGDSWGVELTPALCAGTTFGVGFQCSATAADANVGIDYVQMRIHFVVPLVVGEGVVAGVGAAPGLALGVGVEAGAGIASGAAPWIDLGVGPGAGTASAAGTESKLSLTIAPQEGTAVAVGATPTPSLSFGPAPAIVAATGGTADASLGLAMQSGLIAATGATPQLIAAGVLTPTPGQVNAQGEAPTRSLAFVLETASGSVSSTGNAPPLDFTFSPSPGTAAAIGGQPARTATLVPVEGAASAVGASPALTTGSGLTPISGSTTASGNAPTIGWTLTGETGATLAAGSQPSLFQAFALTPQAGLTTALGHTPDPIVIYTITDVEVPGEIWGIGNAPTVTSVVALLPESGTVLGAGTSPALTLTLGGQIGLAGAQGATPTLVASAELSPTAGQATADGNPPSLEWILPAVPGLASAEGSQPSVTQAFALFPQTGTITAPGATPDPIVIYTVSEPGDGGIVWGIGNAPEVTQTVTAELIPEQGVVLGVGGAPVLSRELQAVSGVVAGVGNAPDVALQGTIAPQAGVVLAVGDVPTSALSLGVLGGVASTGGTAPSLSGELLAQAGAASAQGAIPTITLQAASSPITGVATLAGSEPALALSLGVQSGAASATGAMPSLGVESALTPIAGAAAASGNAPTLTLVQVLSPQAGQADATGASPPRSSVLQAAAGQSTATGAAPSFYIQTANTPIEGLIAASGNAPALARQLLAVAGQTTAQGNTPVLSQTLPIQTGLASAAGYTPTLSSQFGPVAGLAAASGNAPNTAQQLSPSAGLGSALGNAPTRTLTLQAVSGAALATGNQPVTWLQAENSPLTGIALASGTAPTLSRALAPTRGIATASGTPPHVSTGLDLNPQTSTIQASGNLSLRQLSFGPAPATTAALGSAPALTKIFVPAPDGIILASGPSPALAQALTPTTATASAVGNEPERLVTRFIFPETGSALATATETSTLTLILELVSTTILRAVGNPVEMQLALPGNRRETALTRLYARLLLLAPSGVLVARNSTIPLMIPPAGAVVLLDSGPDTTDRGTSEDFYEHRVRLELFILQTNPLAKTIQDLEDEVAATLAGDRTLGGVIDQMFLLPTSSLALSGGGTPIDINALSVALTYGEPHAAL